MEEGATQVQRRGRGPSLNLYDMPEMMPGAQPGANPAARELFENRCIKLHQQAEMEEYEERAEASAASGSGATGQDLAAMFPALDADLIRAIVADSASTPAAIETLIQLSAATSEVGPAPRATTPPPRDLGVSDQAQFPSLCDADGWEVVGHRQLEQLDGDLGSNWRDRAKAGADAPDPAPVKRDLGAWGRPRKEKAKKEEEQNDEQPYLPTDYDARHARGQHRAQNRTQYGRGAGRKGAGRGQARLGGEDAGEAGAYDDVMTTDEDPA